jgi:DNA-binding LacI/PurR family transcriptional regulator
LGIAWEELIVPEPTMSDIAQHLGVSRQLVSIVLRDMPGASDETRARVKQAAKELGYNPHQGARMLRQYRRRQIGVAFAPAHAPESDIVESIYQAVADHGLQVVLSAQTRTRSTEQAIEELLGYRCAAMIMIGPELDDASIRSVAERTGLPLVAIERASGGPTYDVVRSAGDDGIQAIVRHLVGLGHHQVAYVNTPTMPAAPLRLEGFLSGMMAAGLQPDVIATDGPDYTEEAGATAARQLMSRTRLPTAVLASNDQVALGLMHVLCRAGIRIPEDVSLTGFDDSRYASMSSVDLTTVRQDRTALGRAAVEAAVQRIASPESPPGLRIVPTTVVLRSSTAPPRLMPI